MNTLDLAQRKVKMQKASSTNGGEWQGPCPGCGGDDRFHVWPTENEGKGGYWCRGCGKTGDNIQFLRDFEGMTFKDACAELNIDLPERPGSTHSRPSGGALRPSEPLKRPEFQPEKHIPPADLWQEKAERFVLWAEKNLQDNVDAIAWLAERGISAETAANFRIGWNQGEKVAITDAHAPHHKDIYRPRKSWGLPEVLKDDGKPKALWIPRGLVIPYIIDRVVYRIRIRRPEGEPRYYVIPGSAMPTMIIGRERRAFVVVESELDAIACAAACPLAGAVALGSVATKPDAETFAILQGALQILNALDYGDVGGGAKAAEKAMTWWREQFPRCDRWPVPNGKDPGEAVRLGTDLNQWIRGGMPPALTIGDDDDLRGAKVEESATTQPRSEAIMSKNELTAEVEVEDLAPEIRELHALLRKNPSVRIINAPGRFTVLRDGKYVGGRINELVFRTPVVTDYILNHPAEEIDGGNFIVR